MDKSDLDRYENLYYSIKQISIEDLFIISTTSISFIISGSIKQISIEDLFIIRKVP